MPKLSLSYPKYRFHRASGQAVVTIDGRDFYLGPHGSRTSKVAYDRKIAEWLAGGRHLPDSSPSAPNLRVTALIALYWKHCKVHYRHDDGTPTSELALVRLALKPMKALYGTTPAVDFGPLGLKAVDEGVMDKDFNGRKWDVAVTPMHRHIQQVQEAKAEREKKAADKDVDAVWQHLHRTPDGDTMSGIHKATKLSQKRTQEAVQRLRDRGEIEDVKVLKGGGNAGKKNYSGVKLQPQDFDDCIAQADDK